MNKNQRSEIVFLYDVKYCNPNGDPMDANRPRIDEETGKCLVTDVRLKRTIRDYLFEKGYNGSSKEKDIFVRDENGEVVTGAQRSKAYEDIEEFKQFFIDVRLFGGVSAPKGESDKTFNITGPVQFGMGCTLNKVKENFIKGTGAFATKETSSQKTFREEYNITYGLVGFHGVINGNAAQYSGLQDADLDELIDAIWKGTKNLLTRSKKGHMPRLLLKIDYKEPNYFIGDLVERIKIKLNEGIKEEELSDVQDYILDIDDLNSIIEKNKSNIEKCTILNIDDRLKLSNKIIEI
jgi:CRISPR-associated protein Csh2